jgi:hypothetical protein
MGIAKIAGVNVYEYYVIDGVFGQSQFGPADATTYYGGFRPIASTTTAAISRLVIPQAGTITRCDVFVANDGTLGSGETSTLSIRLNNTTDTTVTSALTTNNAANVFTNSSLSIAVSAGDYIEFKWVTPTWATNPTSVRILCRVSIRKDLG